MQDQDKTREQLITELNEMRRKVAELETAESRGQDIEKILKESEKNAHLNRSNLISESHPIENQELASVIDIPQIQSLMDDFYKLTNIGIAILDLKGNILVATGWQDICTKFHRLHPDTLRNCVESDLHLTEKVNKGEYLVYKCKNNMWDMVTPIVMGGKRVGNLYLGQFLFEDEVPDIEVFEAQAQQYGFNKDEYLAALNMVPRWSRDKVHTVMTFYSKFALMLSELGYSNLGLKKMLIESQILAETLRESEQRLQLALEGGALGLWDWNLKTGRAVWSEWAIRMLGYELDELDPNVRTWKRAVHSDDWETVSEVLNGHLSGRLPCFEAEYRIQTKSGEWKWVQARGKVAEYDKEGKPQRITGTMLDITERRKAEEELRKSEEKYRRLVENAYDIVYSTDPKGCVTFLNPAGLQHIRYSQEEVIGRNYLEFIPEEYREHISRFYSRQFLKKIPDTYYEFPFVVKDGEIRWYGQKTQLLVENGSILGFQSIARDITDRKRLEEENLEMERKLLHAQKLESLAVMAGGIAHDFNNQLAVVLGNLELGLMDLAPDSVVRPSVMNAIQAAKRSAELCRQIQIYTGNTFYNPVDLDLNELLNTNPIPMQLRVSRNVTLNLESYNALLPIKGDPDQIQCLVTNILVNASEAVGDKNGEVRLSTGVMDCDAEYLSRSRLEEKPEPGRFVFLDVTDTGCGMAADTQRRLFDPFFSTKFWGRGLGMSKVIGITKGHHGAIIVDSEVGKGTTIRVLFPVSKEAQASSVYVMDVVQTKPPVPESITRRKTILVVDDEAGVRDIAVRRLDVLGYDTIVAGDGEEGVNVFRERLNEIDLVMLDFKMPKMNGVETFGELIRIKPDVRVILCSGYTEDVVMQSFPGQRPAVVLHKPYNMEDLKGELDRLLGTDG